MFDNARAVSGARGVSRSNSNPPAPQGSWREAARNADEGAGRPAVAAAEIANVFIQLRQYLQISLHQAAALLNTDPDVIAALETGATRDLPAWPETNRIVCAYASLANIDPAPVLRCLEGHCRLSPERPTVQVIPAVKNFGRWYSRAGLVGRPRAKQIPSYRRSEFLTAGMRSAPLPLVLPEQPEPDAFDEPDEPVRSWFSRLPGRSVVWRATIVASLLAALGFGSQQGVREAAVGKLPTPVAQLARDTEDMVLVRMSSRFEGMPWINVADPRSRRGDKLRTKPR